MNLYQYYLDQITVFKNNYIKEKARCENIIKDDKLKEQLLKTKNDYCELPDYINKLLLQNNNLVRRYITYIYKSIDNFIKNGKDNINIIRQLNKKSERLGELYKIILNWLLESDFINNIIENNDFNIISPNDIPEPSNQLEVFNPRINQKEAFDRLERYGLETGIHCQATGCGKSFIILRYIDYCIKKYGTDCKIVLFTERVNILADLFNFKGRGDGVNKENIKYWKSKGIADLSKIKIINRVTIKKNDWINKINESKKAILIVINRAYLTLRKQYKNINNLSLILHDECHNTTSVQCHAFLLNQKKKNIPIVGFSATPLRTGKYDYSKLIKIYDNEEPLLTNYNMIYAISQKLILPPKFYWYQIDETLIDIKKKKIYDIEYGTVLSLLSSIVPGMVNKKLIAWCGKIDMAKKWKDIFIKEHKKYAPLYNFKFFLDTSKNKTTDSVYDYDKFKNLQSNGILFCANKHREGSDIYRLDGCIFLDRVKTRGCIPFIQSIGRVLRYDPNKLDKKEGIVIDGIYKNHNTDTIFIDKIIGYYCSLENVLGNLEDYNDKISQYIKLKDMVKFSKNNEKIEIDLGTTIITIILNNLGWNSFISNFDGLFQKKLKMSEKQIMISKKDILINKYNFNNKTDFIKEYNNISKEDKETYNLPDIRTEEYQKLFNTISWFNILKLEHNYYPDIELAKDELIKKGIKLKKPKRNWLKWCKIDERLPPYPEYLWCNFTINCFTIKTQNNCFI